MLQRLRNRSQGQEGFTLIELLVVILIIGILAAIAIPSFLNQKGKASDASAKELARSAQTTAETVATDNAGSYATVTTTSLNATEPSIPLSSTGSGNAFLSAVTSAAGTGTAGTATGYTVTTTSTPTGTTFSITNAAGVITRTCNVPTANTSKGGCNTTTGNTGAGTW